MTLVDEILDDAGFSKSAIDAVKAGKLHYGGSLDAASDKELSVKLAFHLKAELQGAKEIFLASPKKKEYDPTVQSLGKFALVWLESIVPHFHDAQPYYYSCDARYYDSAPHLF